MGQNKGKIEAKNGLENYCFTMRNTLQEEKLKDKFEGDDKDNIEKAVQETQDWLDKNQLAEKDEFEAKQKEIEGVVNPIMMKVYQAAGGWWWHARGWHAWWRWKRPTWRCGWPNSGGSGLSPILLTRLSELAAPKVVFFPRCNLGDHPSAC